MGHEQTSPGRTIDTLWYTRCPVPTAFPVALHLGWLAEEFRDDGIAITSLRASADLKVRESHFSHSLEDSLRYGGNIPPIWARSEGADNKLIGLSVIDSPHVILALPGSAITGVQDLRGRRLSLPRRTRDLIDFWRAGALRTYEVALATAGLSLDDVELVDIPIGAGYLEETPPPDAAGSIFNSGRSRSALAPELFALVRGEVDAVFSESYFATDLRKFLGARVVYDVDDHADPLQRHNNAIPQALTVSAGLLRDHPDLVVRLLVRILEAGEWAKTHRAEVIHIAAQEAGASEEVIAATYPNLERQLGTDLSPTNVELIRRRKQFLLAHGVIGRDFPLDDWIVRWPLERAAEIVRQRRDAAA